MWHRAPYPTRTPPASALHLRPRRTYQAPTPLHDMPKRAFPTACRPKHPLP